MEISLNWTRICEGERRNLPIAPSSTNTVMSGSTASPICTISWNSSLSCKCLPEVSTMITSNRSDRNFVTPSRAIETGSVSVYLCTGVARVESNHEIKEQSVKCERRQKACLRSEERNFGSNSVLPQLIECTSTERICAHECYFQASTHVMSR